jgi:hypothetical protein
VLFHGLDKDLDTWDGDFAQFHRERGGFFSWDAAGAAVGDVAGGIERAEVRTDGDVAFFELEANAGGFQRTAAD